MKHGWQSRGGRLFRRVCSAESVGAVLFLRLTCFVISLAHLGADRSASAQLHHLLHGAASLRERSESL